MDAFQIRNSAPYIGSKVGMHIPEADGVSPEQRGMKLRPINYPMCGLFLFQKESRIQYQSQRLDDALGEDLVQTQSAHFLEGSGLSTCPRRSGVNDEKRRTQGLKEDQRVFFDVLMTVRSCIQLQRIVIRRVWVAFTKACLIQTRRHQARRIITSH